MKVRGGNKANAVPATAAAAVTGVYPHPPLPAGSRVSELNQERQTDKYTALVRPPPPPGGRTNALRGVELTAYAASDAAETEAAAVVTAMTHRPDIQKKLKLAKIELVIIPQSQKMTDLPQFASLHGQSTFDGRAWDSVRGVGGTHTPAGRIAVGIPEENLANLPGDSYPGNYSVATHELAHVIHEYGLTKAEKKEVEACYAARKAEGGPWTEAYGSSNSHEYFAQATTAFFGRNSGMGHNGHPWLLQNDPRLFTLLVGIYGPPPATP